MLTKKGLFANIVNGWKPFLQNTEYKVSVFGVILVGIQSECGKMWTRITPNTDTFQAMESSILDAWQGPE